MNAKEKKLIVKGLRAAKKHLEPSIETAHADFICIAAADARRAGKISGYEEQMVVALIHQRLGNIPKIPREELTAQCWLERWLQKHPKKLAAYQRLSDSKRDHLLQQWRHAWVDSLIEEFTK